MAENLLILAPFAALIAVWRLFWVTEKAERAALRVGSSTWREIK